MAQGFPDWPTPQFLLDALGRAVASMENQYVRCGGHPKYVEELARYYSPIFNRTLNPLTDISVGNGATQILSNAMCAFLEDGDEVIVIEPFFEFYIVEAKIFGGKLRYFTIDPPAEGSDVWTINFEKLEALFNEKTRLIIVNTPHNPTGKVMTLDEYLKLQAIMNKFPRVILLSDEVKFLR
jgi:aspartate/methionine/tyrosine aminotransferase